MTKKELIMQTLEKMGYSPEEDEDGDITFLFQMKHLYVMVGNEDEKYVSVLLPQFRDVDEGKEALVLAVCNKMTCETKLLKVYVDHTYKNVTASCEFFYTDEESFEQSLTHSLKLLGMTRSSFMRHMREMEK